MRDTKDKALKLAHGYLDRLIRGLNMDDTSEAVQVRDAIKQARSAPVHDEHQAFIDSLPKDGDDKVFMQIDHWARQSYKRHQSSVRGQMITAADSYESHVIWATLRWVKENTPPAAQPAPVQEPVAHCEAGPRHCQQCHLEDRSLALAAAVRYVQNNTPKLVFDEICMALTTQPAQPAPVQEPVAWAKQTEKKLRITHMNMQGEDGWKPLVYGDTTPPAAQRQWVGLTDEEINNCCDFPLNSLGMKHVRKIEAKLKEKNGV